MQTSNDVEEVSSAASLDANSAPFLVCATTTPTKTEDPGVRRQRGPQQKQQQSVEVLRLSAATRSSQRTHSHPPTPLGASPRASASEWVVLSLRGTIVRTSRATLQTAPRNSRLRRDVESDFQGLPRDGRGVPMYNSDPTVFKYLLNYLRGYPVSPAALGDVVFDVVREALAYGLRPMAEGLGYPPIDLDAVPFQFAPGPGVAQPGFIRLSSGCVTNFIDTAIDGRPTMAGTPQEPSALCNSGEHTIAVDFEGRDVAWFGLLHRPDHTDVPSYPNGLCDVPLSVMLCTTGDVIHNPSPRPRGGTRVHSPPSLQSAMVDSLRAAPSRRATLPLQMKVALAPGLRAASVSFSRGAISYPPVLLEQGEGDERPLKLVPAITLRGHGHVVLRGYDFVPDGSPTQPLLV